MVLSVAPGSPAHEAGLEVGDTVLEVNRVAVDTLAAFNQAFALRAPALVLVQKSDGGTLFYPLGFGTAP